MLTTYGYALLGGSVVQPIIASGTLTPLLGLGLAAGMVLHGLALYIAPRGEKP